MSVVGPWATAAQARQLGFDWINDVQEAAGHTVGPVARLYMHSAGPSMMMITDDHGDGDGDAGDAVDDHDHGDGDGDGDDNNGGDGDDDGLSIAFAAS